MSNINALILAMLVIFPVPGFAGEVDEALVDMQQAWALANYANSEDAKEEALEQLLPRTDAYAEQYPDKPEILIWSGIIKSTYAGVKGGLGALKYAKAARNDLQQAMKLDADALDGSAYTSLGTLYFKVPGWPIAFGDRKKAEKMLRTALDINPDGIDPNFFYGEFLIDDGRYQEATNFLTHAMAAPVRPDRPIADAGRREEIRVALAKAQKKLR